MSDAYRFLAPFYQFLSQLVFGKDLLEANQFFLEKNRKSLIIGGGDGYAYRDFRNNLEGEFWDLSPGMTHLAKKNLEGSGLIIQAGAWPGKGKFDRVYLPFVLDTMPDEEIIFLVDLIRKSLLPQGEIVISDFFEPVGFGQMLFQKAMIIFFRVFTSHRRNDLPDILGLLKKEGFTLIQEKCWRKGWIRTQIWRTL